MAMHYCNYCYNHIITYNALTLTSKLINNNLLFKWKLLRVVNKNPVCNMSGQFKLYFKCGHTYLLCIKLENKYYLFDCFSSLFLSLIYCELLLH